LALETLDKTKKAGAASRLPYFRTMVLLKRTLISAVVFIVLLLVGAWVFNTFFVSSQTETRKPKRAAVSQAKPWDGKLTKLYNTAFVRAGDQIKITQIGYEHLDSAATDVAVNLSVIPSSGEKPEWLIPTAFQVRAAGSQRVFKPRVRITPQGASTSVLIKLSKLPTTALGATCSGAPSGPDDDLNLRIYGPDGVFEIQLLPPAAPAGHCFSKPFKEASQCKTADTQLQALNATAKARTTAIKKAKKSARAKLVAADKAADKKDAQTRLDLNAILDGDECVARKPAKGSALSKADKKRDQAAYYASLGLETPSTRGAGQVDSSIER
jgi:hypothetical protein